MGVDKLEVEGKALTIIKKSRSIAIDKSEIRDLLGSRGAGICSRVVGIRTSKRTITRMKSVLGFLKIEENDR
ncbi:hypothetical protein Gotur_035495, partial [Gossypium turneri]